MTTTTQITATNLADLNVLKLYEHYQILERSMPLLTPESQAICKAELEQTVALRSDKIDRIYYALAAHEDAIERVKKSRTYLLQLRNTMRPTLLGLKDYLIGFVGQVLSKKTKSQGVTMSLFLCVNLFLQLLFLVI